MDREVPISRAASMSTVGCLSMSQAGRYKVKHCLKVGCHQKNLIAMTDQLKFCHCGNTYSYGSPQALSSTGRVMIQYHTVNVLGCSLPGGTQ